MGIKIKPKAQTAEQKKAAIEKRAKAKLAAEKAAQAEKEGYRSAKAMDKKRIKDASKASKQEEKTKRIAIRQGERTQRVRARHGASMAGQEKLNRLESKIDAINQNMQGQTPANPQPPAPDPQMDPSSNGTGSARPVFTQQTANDLEQINKGDAMSNVLFNKQQATMGASMGSGGVPSTMLQMALGGAKMNGGPGDKRKKPTANIMQSDATRNEIPGVQQMKGEFAGLEMRKTGDPTSDFWSAMNEDNAKMWNKSSGFYSDAYRKQRVHDLGWDVVSRPGPLNKNYGKTYELPKEKPKSKTTQIKKTMAPNKQLKARKVGKISGASMNGDNGYTYTTTDSKGYAKQKRKEDRKKKVSVSKSKTKKEYKGRESEWLPMSAYKTKRKQVKTKRADRMTKRGWKKDIYM